MRQETNQNQIAAIAEFKAAIARENAESRSAARYFESMCKSGDADNLYNAAQRLHNTVDSWRLAMRRVARLPHVSAEIREAFVPIWVESKFIPLSVGHRPTMAAALRVLMRGDYSGGDLRLFRGTTLRERQRRLYSFSWTTKLEIAESFARRWNDAGTKSVVLTTLAPATAIFLKRQPDDDFDEDEVVVDPYRLDRVDLVVKNSSANGAVVRLEE